MKKLNGTILQTPYLDNILTLKMALETFIVQNTKTWSLTPVIITPELTMFSLKLHKIWSIIDSVSQLTLVESI